MKNDKYMKEFAGLLNKKLAANDETKHLVATPIIQATVSEKVGYEEIFGYKTLVLENTRHGTVNKKGIFNLIQREKAGTHKSAISHCIQIDDILNNKEYKVNSAIDRDLTNFGKLLEYDELMNNLNTITSGKFSYETIGSATGNEWVRQTEFVELINRASVLEGLDENTKKTLNQYFLETEQTMKKKNINLKQSNAKELKSDIVGTQIN